MEGAAELFWLWADRITIIAFYVLPITAYIWRNRIRRWWRRNQFSHIGGSISEDRRWDAIVCMPTNDEVGHYLLTKIKPSHIGFLKTHWNDQYIESLKQCAQDLDTQVNCVLVDESDDPTEFKRATLKLIEQMKLAGYQNIAIDITGGCKPMTIGMFMAAEESGCDSIYVGSKWSKDTHEIIPGTRRLVRISSPAESVQKITGH